MLDPYPILKTLGLGQPAVATPLHGGADTAMWRVDCGNTRYALRVFRPEQQGTFQGEQIAMRFAADGGLPVPHVCAAGIWQDRPALLLSWCPGRTLMEQIQLQPWRTWPLGIVFGRAQALMHKLTVPADLVPQAPNWISWQIDDDPELHQALRRLALRADAPIHLDYHPLNVMVDGGQVTGILDWANAHTGDPRADLARTYTILRVHPHTPHPSPAADVVFWILEKAWWRGYRQVAGPVAYMLLFYVWAGILLVHDLAPRVNRPGFWYREQHMEQIRAWTNRQRQRAGLRA